MILKRDNIENTKSMRFETMTVYSGIIVGV